jgi:hypothetical protein
VIISEEDYLKHYVIIGMHWGTRNIRSVSGSRRIGYDDDINIKKGTKLYRISANKKDTGDYRYVTVDGNDRNFYKGTWPRALKTTAGVLDKDSKIYEHKYKTKEALRSPSAKLRQKVASDMMNKPEIQSEIAKALMIDRYSRNTGLSIKISKQAIDYGEILKNKDYLDIKKKTIDGLNTRMLTMNEIQKASLFIGSMGTNDHIRYEFGKAFVEKGYNTLIDDHGADFAGNRQRVNAPLIVLKADQILKQIGSKPVSNYSSIKAMNEYNRDIRTIPGKVSESSFVPNVIKTRYNTKNYYNNPTSGFIYDDAGDSK